MSTGLAKSTGAAILSRALESKGREISPEGARFILNLGIREEDKARTLELLGRNRREDLTSEEKDELDSYIQADNMLSILKAKALVALKCAGQEP